jgi:hypothetical protein
MDTVSAIVGFILPPAGAAFESLPLSLIIESGVGTSDEFGG